MKLGLGNILDHLGWDKAGQISQDFTQSTTDKWFKDQDKDTVELVGAVIATAGAAGIDVAGVAGGAGSQLLAGIQHGLGILQGGLGSIGQFFSTPLGKAAAGVFGLSGGNGGLLEMLGLTGRKKDMVEEMLTLAALSELGNKFAKEAINKAKEYDTYERDNILGLVNDANKFDDPTYKQQLISKNVENVHNQYAAAAQAASQDLYSRGMGERTPGVTAGILSNEAQAKSAEQRDTETALTNNAMTARLNLGNVLASASGRANTEANTLRQMPFQAYQAIKADMKPDPMADYYSALAQQMKNQNYGLGGSTDGGIAPAADTSQSANAALLDMYSPYPTATTQYTQPVLDDSILNQQYPYAYKPKPLFPSMK